MQGQQRDLYLASVEAANAKRVELIEERVKAGYREVGNADALLATMHDEEAWTVPTYGTQSLAK